MNCFDNQDVLYKNINRYNDLYKDEEYIKFISIFLSLSKDKIFEKDSMRDENKNLTVFIINKNDKSELVEISTKNSELASGSTIITYTGNGPDDESPTVSEATVDVEGGIIKTELAPVSLNVISLKLK